MKKNKILLLLFSIMLICMTSCEKHTEINKEDNFYRSDEKVFLIETEYADLYFPMTWSEQVEIEVNKEKQNIIQFSTLIEEEKILLFDIIFNEKMGNKIGTFKKDNNKIDVYVKNYTLDLDKYSEDQKIDINGMKEDINVIISKLIENYDLKLA